MDHDLGITDVATHQVRVAILACQPTWAHAVSRTIAGTVTPFAPACFTSLAQAADHFASAEVDLVFLELTLEDSRGLATLQAVRQAAPVAAIVVMTSEEDEELALEALRQGAQDYLVKGRLDSTVLRSTARFALERMRAVMEVHQWQHVLAMTLDALPAGVALLDATGHVQMINQAWKGMAEMDNPLMKGCEVGTNYLALCDRLSSPRFAIHTVAKGILQVLAGLVSRFSMEYAVPHASGAAWFELDITRFVLPMGTSVVVSQLDVTERHALQSQLVLHEALHGRIGMEAGSLVAVVDVDGTCRFHQPGTSDVPCDFRERFQDREAGQGLLAGLFRTGSLEPRQVPMVSPEGAHGDYLLSGAIVSGVQDQPPLALMVARKVRQGGEAPQG